ncbi:MAG: rod-binding protein [Phycisphaerae bacterium]
MNGIDLPDAPLLGADPLGPAVEARLSAKQREAARGLGAARDFEAVLLHRMMESMRRTVPDGGLFSSPATRQMEGLFWFYLAQEVARKGGIGLWKDLARSLDLAGGDAPSPQAQGPQA